MDGTGPLSQRLDALLARLFSTSNIPGLAFVAVQPHALLLAKGYGRRSIAGDPPVDEHTAFAIGSLTKAFTATALATLVDEGALTWDERVSTHLPHLRTRDPWVTDHLTLRDLLAVRVGLAGADAMTFSAATPDAIFAGLRELAIGDFRTTQGDAGNTCYFLAGQLIEAVAGVSWEEYLRRTLLAPLAMLTASSWAAAPPADPNHATPHRPDNSGVAIGEWHPPGTWLAPVGALGWSTALDQGKWLQFLLRQGKVGQLQLVSVAALHETWRPQVLLGPGYRRVVEPPGAELAAYGFGWIVRDYRHARVLEHPGTIGAGFTALTVIVPERQFAFCLLTNLAAAGALEPLLAVRLAVLDLLLEPAGHRAV